MPQFTDSADAYLYQQIRNLQNAVQALATQGAGLPVVVDTELGTISTTSESPATISGSPTVVAPIGMSGDAYVFVTSTIALPSTNLAASVYLTMDGEPVSPSSIPILLLSSTSSEIDATVACGIDLWQLAGNPASGVNQGSHVFGLLYQSSNGSLCEFTNTSIMVMPANNPSRSA